MKMQYHRIRKERRAVLWLRQPWEGPGAVVSWWRDSAVNAGVSFGGEDAAVRLTLGCWPFTVSFALLGVLPSGPLTYGHSRRTGFRLFATEGSWFWRWHDALLTVRIWDDGMSWRHDQLNQWPWENEGWSFMLHPFRWVFGDTTLEKRDAHSEATTVVMPEGRYPAKVETYRCRWARPRWPWARWVYRASIEVEPGIPVPGKGTASYNCGDDAVYGCTFAIEDERSPAWQVARRMALSALDSRQRYADLDWVPDDGWPEVTP